MEKSPHIAQATRPRASLGTSITITGKGIHSAIPCRLTLLPAEPGTGRVFVRTDLPGAPRIPVSYQYLAAEELDRRTTLRKDGAAVHTIEHVLSALVAAGVDDVEIQMDAAEPPFVDGSALPYMEAINAAGVIPSSSLIAPIVLPRPITFALDGAEICAIPSRETRVSFFFTSGHPRLRSQSRTFVLTPGSFLSEIAPARTFCFFDEIEGLRKANLIKGANLNSAVVIGKKALINDKMRFPDEPVRHKILDFLGDMALLEAPIQGHFMIWRSGHRINAAFGQHLKKELNL